MRRQPVDLDRAVHDQRREDTKQVGFDDVTVGVRDAMEAIVRLAEVDGHRSGGRGGTTARNVTSHVTRRSESSPFTAPRTASASRPRDGGRERRNPARTVDIRHGQEAGRLPRGSTVQRVRRGKSRARSPPPAEAASSSASDGMIDTVSATTPPVINGTSDDSSTWGWRSSISVRPNMGASDEGATVSSGAPTTWSLGCARCPAPSMAHSSAGSTGVAASGRA